MLHDLQTWVKTSLPSKVPPRSNFCKRSQRLLLETREVILKCKFCHGSSFLHVNDRHSSLPWAMKEIRTEGHLRTHICWAGSTTEGFKLGSLHNCPKEESWELRDICTKDIVYLFPSTDAHTPWELQNCHWKWQRGPCWLYGGINHFF